MPEDKVQKSEMETFLGDIPVAEQQVSDDVFGENKAPEVKPEQGETDDEHSGRKERWERRLREKYQKERESNIQLAAKLEAVTEAQKFAREANTGEVDTSLLTLYGDNDAGRQAARLTQDLLNKTKEQARQEALEAFRQEQSQAQQAVKDQQVALDEMLESVEDEFTVDLTSNTPAARKARQGFYAALEKMSPKDKEGQVIDYADPLATWEYYQSTQKSDNNRAKDLGSRSMVKSGASGESKLEQSATERFLADAGII